MNVLAVCLGNRWRSPVAACLLAHLRPDWGVRSAGLALREGVRMERPAREYMTRHWPETAPWCDIHRSQTVTPEALLWADEVLVMSPHHAQRVDEMCPEPRRLVQVARYAGEVSILDPHMRPRGEQVTILRTLCRAVAEYARQHP